MRRDDHEMTDSSHLVGDGPALRARIGAYGYVFLRQLLPPDVVRAVGSAGLRSLQRAGWTASGLTRLWRHPSCPSGLSGCARRIRRSGLPKNSR